MALDQIDRFMAAIRRLESGSFDGNYSAVGPYTGSRYGRARGAYQIMQTIWPGWAREAGVDPSDTSKAAQDRVARHKMTQYYNRYGNWDLVAVAWFSGPGRADKAARAGVSSLEGISDVLGTSVPKYVNLVRNYMGDSEAAKPSVHRPRGGRPGGDFADPGGEQGRVTQSVMPWWGDPGSLGPAETEDPGVWDSPIDDPAQAQTVPTQQAPQVTEADTFRSIISSIAAETRRRGGGVIDAAELLRQEGRRKL